MERTGKHAGKRRAEPPPKPAHEAGHRMPLLLHALGVTLAVVAWGYLVYAAIDFGSTARGGRTSAWWLLGLASVGAVACLFVGLLLITRLLRLLGVARGRAEQPTADPRPAGGKRIAR